MKIRYLLLFLLATPLLTVGAEPKIGGTPAPQQLSPAARARLPKAPILLPETAGDRESVCKRCLDCEEGWDAVVECEEFCKSLFPNCMEEADFDTCYGKNKDCLYNCSNIKPKDPLCIDTLNVKYCERRWVAQYCRPSAPLPKR